jgi:raffinose/stachyose/melibiose transport system substrate-binding protein
MDKVAALDSTQAAVHVSPMDWSLGAHLTNTLYTDQSSDRDARLAFINDLKAGAVTLTDNTVFGGWMDTVDALLARNQLADSPLAGEYDDGVLALANGDVGFWFMGNWAVPNLLEAAPDTDFGILPVPISDNAADYGNTQISIGVPAYIVVDAEQSTPEQQAGAVAFLNWLVTSEEGQRFYVEEFKFLPAYSTIERQPADSMNQQIVGYAASGQSLEWMNSLYPADGWPTFGASMQKYLAGQADRSQLAAEFEEYWPTVDS